MNQEMTKRETSGQDQSPGEERRQGQCPDDASPSRCCSGLVSAHFPLHPLTKLPVQEWANANQLGSGWPLQHRLPLSFTLQEKKVILPSDSPALH